MVELNHPEELKAWIRARREAGQRIGFVPTMGFLHEGHLRLVDVVRSHADVVVMSIFVNPLQFGPDEDLARYPRDLDRDRVLAQGRGVDALFVPARETMYPPGAEIMVVPGVTASRWEGASRPGHFTGVLTVVAKLFNLVTPDVVGFGQKDFQQATLIRRMVKDLNWPVEIVLVPTVREPDGLALSSRNTYLDPENRRKALALSQSLRTAAELWLAGERRGARLKEAMEVGFRVYPEIVVEYIAIVDPESMEPVERVEATTVIAVAARVGATRLIDNIVLGQGIR